MRYFSQIWMAAFGIACCAVASSASAEDLSDPFKSMNNESFFNDNINDSLDSDFDKKMGNMLATIKKAQQSTQNTKLGPMGRYVLGLSLIHI